MSAKTEGPGATKKLLENQLVGSIAVPIAIVLVGALVIFGVTKMLSSERSYKDLVREMESKTFGNRWVAAYELSKVISSSSIPEDELPWLVEKLSQIYKTSTDNRTKNFIIVALGTTHHEQTLPTLEMALSDSHSETKFNAIAAIGRMPVGVKFDWKKLEKFLSEDDSGMKQAAILALATHRVETSENLIVESLSTDNRGLRYAAAMGLINYKNEKALTTLKEVLELPEQLEGLKPKEVFGLKMSILEAISKNKWPVLIDNITQIAKDDKNLKLVSKAREVLNELKK